MKLIGLIGGMTWISTIEYYDRINKKINEKLGKWHSAELLMYSMDFDPILILQNENEWDEISKEMLKICLKLEKAKCEAIFICSNTMHKIIPLIEPKINIPFINVINETAIAIKRMNISKIGLLGTNTTMSGGFYKERLEKNYDLDVIIPEEIDRNYINNAIYKEFAIGTFKESTKQKFLEIINKLLVKGAEGIILGCTEIPLLLSQKDISVPIFDTMEIHINSAINFILS